MIELMEGVEDIPGTALYEGIEGPLGNIPWYIDYLAPSVHPISAPKSRTAPFGTTSWRASASA